MLYTLLVPIAGISLLVLMVLTVLFGLRVIKVKMKVHRATGYAVLVLAAFHGVFGWLTFFPYFLPNIISGTVLFLLILTNILLWRAKKIKFKTHRLLGIISMVIALLHGLFGIL